MRVLLTLWHMQLLSIRNTGRYDTRMRVAYMFILAFDILIGGWSGSQLIAHIVQWQRLGPLAVNAGLWSVCLLTWSSMGGITMLESIQQGPSNDTAQLLFTLPMELATRFRAFYSEFFIGRLWNWLALELGVTGVALVITLGWQQALVWLVLLQLGVGCVVCGAMLATLLLTRYVLPSRKVQLWLLGGLLLLAGAVAVALIRGWHIQGITLSFQVSGDRRLWICMVFTLILLLALGPLAGYAGALYAAALLATQGWDRSRKAMGIPGIEQLSHLLAQRRDLVGALFVKGLLNQSRNVLFWARMAIALAACFFFPQVHTTVAPYIHSDTLFVVGYAAGLALLLILEQAPGALSGESNRLGLYLTTPYSLTALLRAKLLVFLLPVLSFGLALDLVFSWRLGLVLGDAGFTVVAVMLVISECIALPVWGSAWDTDLTFVVEGSLQMMLQEEAPISSRRLALINLTLVLGAVSLFVVWKLPPLLALLVLLPLNVVVIGGMLRWSEAHLRWLLRER